MTCRPLTPSIDEIQDTSAHLRTPTSHHLQPKRPTVCSQLIYQARLALLQDRIHGELVLPSISLPTMRSRLAHFQHELSAWRSALPGYITDPVRPDWFYSPSCVLLWRERNLSMIMTKSLLSCPRDASTTPEAFESIRQDALLQCLELAMHTIDAICTFAEAGRCLVRGVNWYAMYFLIQAVLVMDLAWLKVELPPPMDFELARKRAEHALRRFGQTCPSALRSLRFLERVQEHYRRGETAPPIAPPAPPSLPAPTQPHAYVSPPPPLLPLNAAVPLEQTYVAYPAPPQGPSYDPRSLGQDFWSDPSVNPFLEDPWIAPVFDDFAFFQT